MLFQPLNFRRGEARQYRVAHAADGFFQAAEFLGDGLALGGSGCVAPKFCRANDLTLFIERHKAMLLAADSYAFHLDRAGFGFLERSFDRGGRGSFP